MLSLTTGGKNEGCDHFKLCSKGHGYCKPPGPSDGQCSHDYLSFADCIQTKWTENCGYLSPRTSGFCFLRVNYFGFRKNYDTTGPHSRCFMTQEKGDPLLKKKPACLLSSCVNNRLLIKIPTSSDELFSPKSMILECQYSGQVLSPTKESSVTPAPKASRINPFTTTKDIQIIFAQISRDSASILSSVVLWTVMGPTEFVLKETPATALRAFLDLTA